MISGAFYMSVKRTFFEHTNSIVKNTGGDKMEYDAYQKLANAIIVSPPAGGGGTQCQRG